MNAKTLPLRWSTSETDYGSIELRGELVYSCANTITKDHPQFEEVKRLSKIALKRYAAADFYGEIRTELQKLANEVLMNGRFEESQAIRDGFDRLLALTSPE